MSRRCQLATKQGSIESIVESLSDNMTAVKNECQNFCAFPFEICDLTFAIRELRRHPSRHQRPDVSGEGNTRHFWSLSHLKINDYTSIHFCRSWTWPGLGSCARTAVKTLARGLTDLLEARCKVSKFSLCLAFHRTRTQNRDSRNRGNPSVG